MKTTIIDILNKIANGEEPPKKIYYKNEIFEYDEKEKDYANIDFNEYLFDVYLITEILNDEVEILETTIPYKPYNNIKKIKSLNYVGNNNSLVEFEDKQQLNNHILKDKINEIIDHLEGE